MSNNVEKKKKNSKEKSASISIRIPGALVAVGIFALGVITGHKVVK